MDVEETPDGYTMLLPPFLRLFNITHVFLENYDWYEKNRFDDFYKLFLVFIMKIIFCCTFYDDIRNHDNKIRKYTEFQANQK